MKQSRTKKLVLSAVCAALCCAVTMIIQIPVPATNGYINIGDTVIFFCGVMFGPWAGLIAGGIGSSLADLISGYAHWALPTLIIKGLEGFFAGILMLLRKRLHFNKHLAGVLSVITAASVCVLGYFFASAIMYSSFAVALAEIPQNLIQVGLSAVLGYALIVSISRIKGLESLTGEIYFKDYRGEQDSVIAEKHKKP